jgi:hypothetical protein
MLNVIAHLFYEEDSFFVFLLVTIILGGVVRFFHMALFQGHLLTLHYYVVDTVFCLMFGFLGYQMTRAGQMAEQYAWLYRRAGPINWAKKRPAPNAAAPKSG